MLPLNYAILRYFTTVGEASVDDVMKALQSEYGSFSTFKKAPLLNAIMVSEKNAILEESRFELDENNEIRVYFRVTESGTAMIKDYIKG